MRERTKAADKVKKVKRNRTNSVTEIGGKKQLNMVTYLEDKEKMYDKLIEELMEQNPNLK